MTLVDTNVLLDLVTDDPKFADWSIAQLEAVSIQGNLLINDVIFSELSVRYETIEQLHDFVEGIGLRIVPMPKEALFLAGKVYQKYRERGGTKTGVLPDFFIGAQASVLGENLLTRDSSRYKTYYPTVNLIAPEV